MFLHLFYYRLKKILHTKEELFWILFFPIILGTMFYFAFGNINNNTVTFHTIPIAYVEKSESQNTYFNQLLTALSNEGENSLLKVTKTSEKKANELLEKNKVTAIITNEGTNPNTFESKLSLVVNNNGIHESIIKSILDQYLQKEASLQNIAKEDPDALTKSIMSLAIEKNFLKDIQFSNGTMDVFVWYFFSLLAMVCMYGGFSGVSGAIDLKAKFSALGARRGVSPTHHMKLILADFSATVLLQFLSCIVCLFYLIVILNINFGTQYFFILLTCLVGCIIGVSIGWIIGAVGKIHPNTKMGISVAVSMFSCFFSGLMIVNMKDILAKNAPIVNHINPATLLCDAFYSLNIYDNYERFTINIVSLLIIATILCFGSYIATRKDTM